jgi:hypothetical protein
VTNGEDSAVKTVQMAGADSTVNSTLGITQSTLQLSD